MPEEPMSMFAVGDAVVYPPHGPGVVVASPETDGQRMLTIRIARNNLTLSVPESAAHERGVRAAISDQEIDAILTSLTGTPEALHDTPQLRTRAAAEVERSGDAHRLATTIRDYAARQRGGATLTPPERKVFETARLTLASEIALVRKITIGEAEELLDQALA